MQNGLRMRYITAISTTLILMAAILRWISYRNFPLWLDEAWRANIILGTIQNYFAPHPVATLPGYVAWVRCSSFFHSNELALRMSSLVPGALVPLGLFGASLFITRNIILSITAGFLAVFNSDLVAYSHEMKPYALEAFLHSCYWIALFYWLHDQEHAGKFWLFCAFVVAMLLTTPTIIFLLPSALLAVLLAARKRHTFGRTRFIVAFTAISLLAIIVYFLFLSHTAGDSGLYKYWGNNFFSGEGVSRPAWTFKMFSNQFAQAYETPANMRIKALLPWIKGMAILSLFVLIYFGFSQTKNREAIFYLCSPVLVLLVANSLQVWPLGAIRANIFMIPHLILILVLSIHHLLSRMPRFRGALGVLVCMMLFINILPSTMNVYKQMNPPFEDLPTVMQRASQGMMEYPILQEYPILVNAVGSSSLLFYTQYREGRDKYFHPVLLKKQAITIADAYSNPSEAKKQIASALEGKKGAHFFVSHLNEEEMSMLEMSIRDAGWIIKVNLRASGAAWFVLEPNANQS
jgi:hypothetical protein